MARKLKKPVIYSLYGLSFFMLLGGLFLLEINTNKLGTSTEKDYEYVSKTGMEEEVPVISTKTMIIRPYTDADVKIVKDYYNYQGSEDEQKESIIYYEDTYMPSSGVSYGKDKDFSVVSVLDGEVISVKEDTTIGNEVTIKHDSGIMSVYQSIKDIKVKEGDSVKQGDAIAISSTSNISADLNNHLYFELSINEKVVNPEDYYEKAIDEIGA